MLCEVGVTQGWYQVMAQTALVETDACQTYSAEQVLFTKGAWYTCLVSNGFLLMSAIHHADKLLHLTATPQMVCDSAGGPECGRGRERQPGISRMVGTVNHIAAPL